MTTHDAQMEHVNGSPVEAPEVPTTTALSDASANESEIDRLRYLLIQARSELSISKREFAELETSLAGRKLS